MKRGVLFALFLLLLISTVTAQEHSEEIYSDLGEVELEREAGLTPDDALYFIDNFVESILVSDNPERALAYKEEKIAELREMIKEGKVEEAKEALERARKHSLILEEEVSPDIARRARESSKAVKEVFDALEDELEGEEWDDLVEEIEDHKDQEDKIALAAQISSKIKELCESLASLDPLEYESVCKTDDDAPKWKRDLDQELTKEQEKEARKFFNTLSQCFQNPRECKCDEVSIKPFAEQCKIIAPLAAECEEGIEEACDKLDDLEDPIDLLPEYLQDVMDEVEERFGESEHDLHIPKECKEAGALDRKSCMKIMFSIHAPPECSEALERGDISFDTDKEARQACEDIMFELESPDECIEAGLRDHEECEKLMFELDSPQECIEAGLTGRGRNDWKECDKIRFKLDAPEECLAAGLTGTGRDDWKRCGIIQFKLDSPQECLDAGLDGSRRDDWKKCEAIRFRLDSPQECLDAGLDGSGRNDWKKCDAIRFRLDAAQECLDAGLDGTGRDDWKKCEAINFRLDAAQECLDAGLDGTGRNDWDKCSVIQFKLDAPQECLDAGLTGRGRDDWRKCDEIREDYEEDYHEEDYEDYGEAREDCTSDQIHYCNDDGRNCKCVNEEEFEEYREPIHDEPYQDEKTDYEEDRCATILCQEGTYCENGQCISDGSLDNHPDEFSEEPTDEHVDDTSEETPSEDVPEEDTSSDTPTGEAAQEPDPKPEPEPTPEPDAVTGGVVSFFRNFFG
jgi:hypothetical protein